METIKSLSNKIWKEKIADQSKIQKLAQQKSITETFSKLLVSRGINESNLDQFLQSDITLDFPNPFELKDMKKAVTRCIEALSNDEKIGIKLPEAPISISKSDQKGTSFVDADYFL